MNGVPSLSRHPAHPITDTEIASRLMRAKFGLSIRDLRDDVQRDPRPHAMALQRDPGVSVVDFPADDVALPIVREEGIGLVRANVLR